MKLKQTIKVKIVKEELIEFIKNMKKMTNVCMDKHLCNHLIWIVEEHYKSSKPQASHKKARSDNSSSKKDCFNTQCIDHTDNNKCADNIQDNCDLRRSPS